MGTNSRTAVVFVAAALAISACGGSGAVPSPAPRSVACIDLAADASVRQGARSAVRPLPMRQLPAGPAEIPGEYVVKFPAGVHGSARRLAVTLAGASVVTEHPALGVVVARVPAPSEAEVLARLRAAAGVAYVEHSLRAYVLRTPNDPRFPDQWNLGMATICMPAAWEITTGSPAVKVAVVDTGIAAHPDVLAISYEDGKDYIDGDDDPADPGYPDDGFSHGTAVGSVIGAETDNGRGMAGVTWGTLGVRLVIVRALDSNTGEGRFVDVAAGIVWAADRGARVINLSLGGAPGADCPQVIREAVDYAVGTKGAVVVAAAGNDGKAVSCPANLPDVIAVAATDRNNRVTSYSNRGPQVDVAAPGGDGFGSDCSHGIIVASPSKLVTETYWCANGTSFAAPHVSGVIALMIANGITGPDTIRRKLAQTALDIEEPGRDDKSGWGLVQADRAVTP
ncbi:MAG: S8 family serine peptidase [Armatimonadota bacterium]|nr:S8 family serine peptidase [Armatimonadota bacterium]MDR5696386.1 S8 family serine peptidase [Armatimonadota bacterium]